MRTINLLIAILLSLTAKIFILFLSPDIAFGGGNDSNYYHGYAVGTVDYAANGWPVILRFMNEVGIYSREYISYLLLIISAFALPAAFAKLVSQPNMFGNKKNKNLAFFLIITYPTIFFFSLDIYRDVFMCFIWCVAALFYKKTQNSRLNKRRLFILAFVIFASIAFVLRGYLGFSLLAAPLFVKFYKKLKPGPWKAFFIYVLSLIAAQTFGLLEPLFNYRGESGFEEGGSSLGFGLIDRNPIEFILLFFLSFTAQALGFFVPNKFALAVFMVESIPFILAIIYVVKNIDQFDDFCYFLIFFFLIYTTIWVIGNDNLGTAVRLRVPSYLSIFACFFIVRIRKPGSRQQII